MRRLIFVLFHLLFDRRFLKLYEFLIIHHKKPYIEQEKLQNELLEKLIQFAYQQVPYYNQLFNKLNLNPHDIKKVTDLEKLPILTREEVIEHIEDFKPKNLNKQIYFDKSTGGTTGTPLNYKISKIDRLYGGLILYRAFHDAGYKLGDKMFILAGRSLNQGSKNKYIKILHEKLRNIKFCSSFDMGANELERYYKTLMKFKPKFIRAYASSIFFFAKWIKETGKAAHKPLAIFTTSEKLYPEMRKLIEEIFQCKVYDTYGLYDGGISASECSKHNGLHVDTERSILEVVDCDGKQLHNGNGRILATSLRNYAMPFIRYDTGDIGLISDKLCTCGKGSKILTEVLGRSVDIFITPEGEYVHGWFFLYIFWAHNTGIRECRAAPFPLFFCNRSHDYLNHKNTQI